MASYLCQNREAGWPRGAARRSGALSVALWLLAALLLTGVGIFIARSLESGLLGFLGADFLFLIGASVFTSGLGRSGWHGH